MNPWVGRILLLFAVILLLFAFLSAFNIPSTQVTSTQTYYSQQTHTIEDHITYTKDTLIVHEGTTEYLSTYTSVTVSPVTLKMVSLSWTIDSDSACVKPFTENLNDLQEGDEVSVFLNMPAHIQIIGVQGKATEVYDEKELFHVIEYESDYIVRVELDKTKCGMYKRGIEVIINVVRPITGTADTIIETVYHTYTSTSTSYEESYYPTTYTDIVYTPIILHSESTQSYLPNWLMLPFLVGAVGFTLGFLVLRRHPSDRSFTNLGVLMLEDKYFPKEELFDKPVFNSRGMRIGEVIDVGYSMDGKVALVVRIDKDKEKIIPFTQIKEIGDIVLLSPEAEKIRESQDFKGFRKTPPYHQ